MTQSKTNLLVLAACNADDRMTKSSNRTLCEVLTIGELEKIGNESNS